MNNPLRLIDPNGMGINDSVAVANQQENEQQLKKDKQELSEAWDNGDVLGMVGNFFEVLWDGVKTQAPTFSMIPEVGAIDALTGLTFSEFSGMLRVAASSKGNTGLGVVSNADAMSLGKAWLGEGFNTAKNGQILISKDGLRQFRLPSFKPKLDQVQANLEWRTEGTTQWVGNSHLIIK